MRANAPEGLSHATELRNLTPEIPQPRAGSISAKIVVGLKYEVRRDKKNKTDIDIT
jgi:hypothetical protein